jgi:hypothetical protein
MRKELQADFRTFKQAQSVIIIVVRYLGNTTWAADIKYEIKKGGPLW